MLAQAFRALENARGVTLDQVWMNVEQMIVAYRGEGAPALPFFEPCRARGVDAASNDDFRISCDDAFYVDMRGQRRERTKYVFTAAESDHGGDQVCVIDRHQWLGRDLVKDAYGCSIHVSRQPLQACA